MEEGRCPAGRVTGVKMAAVALQERARQAPGHIGIDLLKLPRRVPSAEVAAPATQERIKERDGVAQVPMTVGPRRERLHALSNALHRTR